MEEEGEVTDHTLTTAWSVINVAPPVIKHLNAGRAHPPLPDNPSHCSLSSNLETHADNPPTEHVTSVRLDLLYVPT